MTATITSLDAWRVYKATGQTDQRLAKSIATPAVEVRAAQARHDVAAEAVNAASSTGSGAPASPREYRGINPRASAAMAHVLAAQANVGAFSGLFHCDTTPLWSQLHNGVLASGNGITAAVERAQRHVDELKLSSNYAISMAHLLAIADDAVIDATLAGMPLVMARGIREMIPAVRAAYGGATSAAELRAAPEVIASGGTAGWVTASLANFARETRMVGADHESLQLNVRRHAETLALFGASLVKAGGGTLTPSLAQFPGATEGPFGAVFDQSLERFKPPALLIVVATPGSDARAKTAALITDLTHAGIAPGQMQLREGDPSTTSLSGRFSLASRSGGMLAYVVSPSAYEALKKSLATEAADDPAFRQYLTDDPPVVVKA